MARNDSEDSVERAAIVLDEASGPATRSVALGVEAGELPFTGFPALVVALIGLAAVALGSSLPLSKEA